VIEIFDRVPQLLEHVLLALAVAGDVGDRPHRIFRVPLARTERAHAHPKPAAVSAVVAGDPDLLLLPLAFARGFQEAKYRFRDIGIADEHPLDRPHVLRAGSSSQPEIGVVEIDDVAARVGDGEPIEGVIGDVCHDRVVGGAVGESDDAGG